jgi:hypothetical protein
MKKNKILIESMIDQKLKVKINLNRLNNYVIACKNK